MQIVTGAEMSHIDEETINGIGLSGVTLMENAGRAFVREALDDIKDASKIMVLMGTGHNGGDGFVIARVLLEAGFSVKAWLIPPMEKITGDAREHLDIYEASGFSLQHYEGSEDIFLQDLKTSDLVIDALLGTGARGKPREPYQMIIRQINGTHATVLSVDIPSGVPVDGGRIIGEPLQATRTITLQAPKMSAFMYPAAAYYGSWQVADIGIPHTVLASAHIRRYMWRAEELRRTWPERAVDAHKGSHGKGCIFAGSRHMTGAAVMAAQAALRGGAGLVTMAVPDDVHTIIASQIPEATFERCAADDDGFAGSLPDVLPYDVLAVGPGIGRGEGAFRLMARLLEENKPLIIDADGLYHLSDQLNVLKQRRSATIVTPHPGEMAQLIGCSVEDVQENRFAYSTWFAETYGVYVVLKGPYTIVTTPRGRQYVNTTGNAGLAKGGSGDVLTGLILAAVMQHRSLQPAISNAVYRHGEAADQWIAEERSMTSLLPTDLLRMLKTGKTSQTTKK